MNSILDNMKTSVAMCAYNGEKYIKTQLKSILNQTVSIDEIVICDDGSNDKTIAIIEQFQLEYPNKIFLYKNPINLGSNKNFEKAISICTGDYIFISDQDDIWKEDKVEKIISIFNDNPFLEGVFSNGDLIDGNGNKITQKTLWDNILFLENYIDTNINLHFYITNIRNMVTGATLCIKKDITEFVFPFPNSTAMYHDEWIALILSHRKTLSYSKEPLISYRTHDYQQIGTMKPSSIRRNQDVIKNILEPSHKVIFKTLSHTYKSYFRNYYKFMKLKENQVNKCVFDLDEIIETNKKNILKTRNEMRKLNPILYYLNKTIDKILNKRQL
jgi:glycosyltransferase involved in cell wall biosynthesis